MPTSTDWEVSPSSGSPERDSAFRLEISLAIGYNRRRSELGGAFEGHVVTITLLVGGLIVALLVVYALLQLVQKLPV